MGIGKSRYLKLQQIWKRHRKLSYVQASFIITFIDIQLDFVDL